MNHVFYACIAVLIADAVYLVATVIGGSYVDYDGTLVEPFRLLPLVPLLVMVGVFTVMVSSGLAFLREKKNTDRWVFGLSIGCAFLFASYYAVPYLLHKILV